MRRLLLPLLLAASAASGLAQDADDKKPRSQPTSRPAKPQLPPLGAPAGTYGAGIELEERTPLARVAAAPDDFAGEAIRLEGEIEDVCAKKGCWVVLRDGEHTVRVRFKDYAFFVPRDAGGRRAIVEGQAKAEEISEEMARHYAEESGDPEKAKEIHGPQQVISFTATGVDILGSDELPLEAEGQDEALSALAGRLETSRQVAGGAEGPVEDAAAALGRLRAVPASRTREFDLYTEVGGWYVFGMDGDAPFTHGFAVAKETGAVHRF